MSRHTFETIDINNFYSTMIYIKTSNIDNAMQYIVCIPIIVNGNPQVFPWFFLRLWQVLQKVVTIVSRTSSKLATILSRWMRSVSHNWFPVMLDSEHKLMNAAADSWCGVAGCNNPLTAWICSLVTAGTTLLGAALAASRLLSNRS